MARIFNTTLSASHQGISGATRARKIALSLLLATPLLFSTVATKASAEAGVDTVEQQPHRYELNRSDTLLLLNIDANDQVQEQANFLHLENVYTGQTYRLKMRNGTHLLKLEAGVYRADLDRLNRQLFSSDGQRISASGNAEMTLMPQSVNFAGTWHFESDKKSGSLDISNNNNPAVAVAKKYPVVAGYPLRSVNKNGAKMIAMEWPFNEEEMLSLAQ